MGAGVGGGRKKRDTQIERESITVPLKKGGCFSFFSLPRSKKRSAGRASALEAGAGTQEGISCAGSRRIHPSIALIHPLFAWPPPKSLAYN